MPTVAVMYSDKHFAHEQKYNRHGVSVICDVTTGTVYRATCITSEPGEYRWKDARVYCYVDISKLIYLIESNGNRANIPFQLSMRSYNQEEKNRLNRVLENPTAFEEKTDPRQGNEGYFKRRLLLANLADEWGNIGR